MDGTPTGKILIAIFLILIAIAAVAVIGLRQGAEESTTSTSTTTPSSPTIPPSSPTTPASTPATPTQPAPATISSEAAYTQAMANHSKKVSDVIYALADLLPELQVEDDAWKSQVGAHVKTVLALNDEAVGIAVPGTMADIHQKYLQAMTHYKTAANLLAQGIDESDTDPIYQAVTEINEGTGLATEVAEMINEFNQTHAPNLAQTPATKQATTSKPESSTFEPIVITGSGDKTSPPFTVTTKEWVIDWSYSSDDPELVVFGFFVYPRG